MPVGFNAFGKDRNLLKNSLNIIRIPDVPNAEALFCKTHHGNVKYVIGVVYRSPFSEHTDLIELQNIRAFV